MADDDAEALTFGPMAASAIRQAEYRDIEKGTLRPEADVRYAMWWRVRGLQRRGYLHTLLAVLFLDAAAILVKELNPQATVPFWVFILPLLTAIVFAIVARRSWSAWHLAQVSRRAWGPPQRYVLLHSYASGRPWLVFFSCVNGDAALPESTVPLEYGSKHHLFRDLPPPVGEVRLTGERCTGSIVVPWVSDQPVWPTDCYRRLDLEDPDHLLSLRELVRIE